MSDKIVMNTKKNKDWKVLEFFVPIEERIEGTNDEFFIKGVAINETTTLNNVKYVAEELQKAAETFRNVPVLLDHKNEVKNIVGRTTQNVNWNEAFRRVEFEAQIMDKDIKERIKDGRIGSVSIGAKVQDLTEEEDGSMKAIGIRGLEISLVAVPGDSHANIAQAIQQGLHLKEMASEGKELNKRNNEMAEDEKIVAPEEEVTEEEVPVEAEVESEEVAEEKTQNINVKVDTSEIAGIKSDLSELKALLVERKELTKKVKEEAEEVEAKDEAEDETKGEVSTEAEESLSKVNNLIVEKASAGFALYRNYEDEPEDTELKRLTR